MKELKPLGLVKELMKIRKVREGVLIGLDVGTQYVGVAVSDKERKIALPLRQLNRRNYHHLMQEVDQPLLGLVVGYPYLQQANNPKAFHVKEFTEELSRSGIFGDIPFTYWDESYTSKNAELLLRPYQNLPPTLIKEYSDVFAAVSILQGYLDYDNKEAAKESD